jgi:3-oxoadipate enol-lactonase
MTTININNVPLGYTEAGNRDNRTIVFAHPLLWGAEMFDEMIAELAKDFHVIAIDIHGHGQSGFQEPLTIDRMTDDFSLLLEGLGLPKVIWLGMSIGGMIGMRLALAHPTKLDSLILMVTNAKLDEPEIKKQTLQLWEMFRDGKREIIAEPAMPYFFAKKTFENQPELIKTFRNKLVSFKEADGMFAAAIAAFERDDLSDKISRIKIPTLIITGNEDITATPQEAEFMASRIQNAQLKIFEDTNHLLAIEKPSEVVECIRSFLKQVNSLE